MNKSLKGGKKIEIGENACEGNNSKIVWII